MTYYDSWRAISARIKGLSAIWQTGLVPSGDTFNIWKTVSEQCIHILRSLEEFSSTFGASLPAGIAERIAEEKMLILSFVSSAEREARDFRQQKIQHALLLLSILETEVSFVLSDTQTMIRARSELAFEHLQRMIVVDAEVRAKWENAFNVGEVGCEKLGAVHLLPHGIWAFKVTAEGERTDLVFQEPVRDLRRAEMFAEGLVLTEWKKLSGRTDATTTFAQARQQARDYAHGALAGSELRDYRFAVVVSRTTITPPPDIKEDGVVWKHINIAVSPQAPSKRHRSRQKV
jgi:hypothetical protein